MDLGFHGEVVEFYQRYRRGYPTAVIDSLVTTFGLTGEDVAVDLGCGTGQVALPLAERVRAILAVDPEPDMLAAGRAASEQRGVRNVNWLLGADTDMPALGAALGERRIGVVTIGQALHWMDHDTLFKILASQVRPGGGVAVLTNGTPLWLQDADWSRALRGFMEEWLGRTLTRNCGTDEDSQRRYSDSLEAAGFTVQSASVAYVDNLDLDRIVGGVYSALSVERIPTPEARPAFADKVGAALASHAPFAEHVRVLSLTGTLS